MASPLSPSARKPILISGAGIASLLLSQALRQAQIPFIIFERDHSIIFRAQGYRLRLSAEGLDAIENTLSKKDWEKFWDTCGKTGGAGVVSLNAVTREPFADEKQANANDPDDDDDESKKKPDADSGKSDHKPFAWQAPGSKPLNEILTSRGGMTIGIARGDMRKLFLQGNESCIKWGHTVTGYELTENGVCAIFSDGTKSVEGDMLIAGDGIYSKIAKQLSDGKLKVFDTGARGIHGQAPTASFKGLGEGVFRIVDDSNEKGRVFAITNVRSGDLDNPDLNFGWTMAALPGIIDPPNNDYSIVGTEAANIARSLTKNWHPTIKPIFDNMIDSDAAFWKITVSRPSGVPQWKNQPRVTVIGDAAHSMTPAGGIGANTAVRDSELLGKLLTQAGGYKESITSDYEKEMRIYGSEAVEYSYSMARAQWGINVDEETSATV